MKRQLVLLAVVLPLFMPAAGVGQEPEPEETAAGEIRALRQELQDRRRDTELTWLVGDVMRRGISEEKALEFVALVGEFVGDRPLRLERTRRHAGYDLKLDKPENEKQLSDRVRAFKRDMLLSKVERIAEELASGGDDKSGSSCLWGIRDCIDKVDAIYDACLESSHSWFYCMDLWLDLIEVCEDLAEECEPG